MSWHASLTTDPDVLGGKLVVRGTRLAVEFLLGVLAAGWTAEAVLAEYPGLTPEALRAVFEYAAEVVRDESVHLMHRGVA